MKMKTIMSTSVLATILIVVGCILLVLGILSVTFYFAMNAMNIYIIIKDGMARRAQVVMLDEPVSSLDNYFFSSFLSSI